MGVMGISLDLVEELDGHVRDQVRREGVDPQRDLPVVRRIVEAVDASRPRRPRAR